MTARMLRPRAAPRGGRRALTSATRRAHHRRGCPRRAGRNAHAEPRRLDAGLGDRARDVVELEVEEDVAAVRGGSSRTTVGPGVQEELLADLEDRRPRRAAARPAARASASVVDVEREDQAAAHAVGCGADGSRAARHRGAPPAPATRAAASRERHLGRRRLARARFSSTLPRASARGPTVTRTGCRSGRRP